MNHTVAGSPSIEIELSGEARRMMEEFRAGVDAYVSRRDALEMAVRSIVDGAGTAHTDAVLDRADLFHQWLVKP